LHVMRMRVVCECGASFAAPGEDEPEDEGEGAEECNATDCNARDGTAGEGGVGRGNWGGRGG
jgi:hypothetical protein